jgi:ADP-heptose:LPS heptosyltransferase
LSFHLSCCNQTVGFLLASRRQIHNCHYFCAHVMTHMFKRILVIQTASIGDVILTTPVLEKLHFFFPESEIDLLIKRGNEDLFAAHPFINTLLLWNKSRRKYANLFHLLKKVRANRYDMVVNLQRFVATGFLTAFSGAPERVGFDKNPFSLFFTKRVKHTIGKKAANWHEIHRNLSLITHFTDEKIVKPKLYPSQVDYARLSQFKTRKYICLAPASLWFTKQYPMEKWIDLVRQIDPETHVYLLGSAGDGLLCDAIIAQSGHPNCFSFAGKISLLESAALMRDADMNFVNDSAPLHLASAVNAKTTVVFCSTVPEFGFGPLADGAAIVQIDYDLPCRPCGLHGLRICPEQHFKCAHDIQTEKLLARI